MGAPTVAEIAIESRIEEIARALDLIDRFAEGREIAGRAATAVAVAVDELLSNTIRYGYAKRDMGRIKIVVSIEAQSLCVRIEDDGNAFDPRCAATAALSAMRKPGEGGYGLILLRAIVDELFYTSDGLSNVTRFKKRFDLR
jgi:serine/threonine-protein kinase RsbW